ncbi:hypothetical protein AJ80_03915 [Polytolypa hystricis UAMH7299]|uniref:Iron-sulfur cluster assembly factor IBA57 homolog, mitochondrial n=1 Tax=Polytolypa hystricis (strain UAMH7299) TaxID=1447883 RepID=A0A2B7YDS8_POLH7|nr:hypothetical protein AJ80_03915 [Polytolypa hystricis UAMH7299]
MHSRTALHSICRRCISRRQFSTSRNLRQAVQHDLPTTLPPPAGYTHVTNRALISLTGRDSTSFLQGLITQNIVSTPDKPLAAKGGYYAAFLNAQGRVLNDVFIYPSSAPEAGAGSTDPAYLIEVDKAEVTSLMKHLRKHKLRSKLSYRAVDEGELAVWAVWDEADKTRWTEIAAEISGKNKGPIACVDGRAPGFGARVIASEDFAASGRGDEFRLPGDKVPFGTYTLRRILHGIPEGQGEIIRESALPMEYNMDLMSGIDFHKGCYVGQELTIRTHHTGVVRKRILPVQLYGVEDGLPESDTPLYSPEIKLVLPPAGANISRVSARKGRSAGKFLAGVGNVGLAMCRLEMMTDIALTGESTQYNPEQEFRISWEADGEGALEGGEVKVKALVPPWTREFIMGGAKNGDTPKAQNEVDAEQADRGQEVLEDIDEEVKHSR